MARLDSVGGIVCAIAVLAIVNGAALTAQADVYSYGMTVGPDQEANPMEKLGDGYGSQVAGDLAPPENAGLQGDGTARFSDTGLTNGKHGFRIGGFAAFTVDMRILVEEDTTPDTGRSMNIKDVTGVGRGIALDTAGLRFISGGGTEDLIDVDLSTWHMIRLSSAGDGVVHVYDLESQTTPGLWDELIDPFNGAPPALGGSGFDNGIVAGGFGLNSIDASGGGPTANSKYLVDWVRIDTTTARGAADPIIVEPACSTGVLPATAQTVSQLVGHPPAPILYTMVNTGTGSVNFNVSEVNADGTITDHTWCSVAPLNGSIAAGSSAPISVTPANGLAEGSYSGWFRFDDGCPGATGVVLAEPFNYDPAGPLTDYDGWGGTATTDIIVNANHEVEVLGQAAAATSADKVVGIRVQGVVSVKIKFKKDPASLGTVGNFYVLDPNDVVLARCRLYSGALGMANPLNQNQQVSYTIADTNYHQLEIKFNTGANTTEYIVDTGTGPNETVTYNHSSTAVDGVGAISIERVNNGNPNPRVYLDDLEVSVLEAWVMRELTLNVIGCAFDVTPKTYRVGPCGVTSTYTYRVNNTGAYTIDSYWAVEKDVYGDPIDWPWLTLTPNADQPGGPIAPGEYKEVTATIDWSQFLTGDLTYIQFFTSCGGTDSGDTLDALYVFSPPEGPHVIEYNGDVDPLSANSAGPDWQFQLTLDSTAQGSLVNDPEATDGKAWLVQDTDLALTRYFTFSPTGQILNLMKAVDQGGPNQQIWRNATIVGRVKTVSETEPSGGNLTIYNNRISAEYHWGDPTQNHVVETGRGIAAPKINDGKYHILRLTADQPLGANTPVTVRLYFDENPTPVLTLADASTLKLYEMDAFGFGAGDLAGAQSVYFDYVVATDAGAFAPGEEVGCLGQPLVTLCHATPQDTDGDLDVDLTDFGRFQSCFNGPNRPYNGAATDCICLDVKRDNDVDLGDFGVFQACFNGPNRPASSACAQANQTGG